ncbi:unnamed protein product [Trypanosoma congolense IL3000]|uniref:WGS project CAEQ00000000 data, annotated contig 270 n=1 Tax=Trypanosoma congolense (strain IL3000) TaxID=1068625 RepID=F9WEH9_TRYCI|nr:unnamed protein product [Trypanosoma congolense IL3000]
MCASRVRILFSSSPDSDVLKRHAIADFRLNQCRVKGSQHFSSRAHSEEAMAHGASATSYACRCLIAPPRWATPCVTELSVPGASQLLFPLAVCLSQPKLQRIRVPRSEERVLRLLSRRLHVKLIRSPPNAVQSFPRRLHDQLPVGISARSCKIVRKEPI